MRALHILKTSQGAAWALWQVGELVRNGVDVHVVLPDRSGLYNEWVKSGATLHISPLDFPALSPHKLPGLYAQVRALAAKISPDIIHTHHVGTTLLVRNALGKRHPIARVFQVPGPLHLEHAMFRRSEIATSGPRDYWIATSLCIANKYRAAGIPDNRLFLSYAGTRTTRYTPVRTNRLRQELSIPPDKIVVGNLNYIYRPKYYLGQRVGLKCHEDVIDALAIVTRKRDDVLGLVAGGPWGDATSYETHLRKRAREAGAGRILMPGSLSLEQIRYAWADYDCAVHVPLSENCGGVLEPLLAGIPTIGGNIGGIPELVLDGITGKLVPIRRPAELAETILSVLANLDQWKAAARKGQTLVTEMFDVRRTAREISQIYRHVIHAAPPPKYFSSLDYVTQLSRTTAVVNGGVCAS